MVSPQPVATLSASSPSTLHPVAPIAPSACAQPLAAPSPTLQAAISKYRTHAHQHLQQAPSHVGRSAYHGSASSPTRLKRSTSFIKSQPAEEAPYLWSLYEDLPHTSARAHTGSVSPSADLFLADMPPMQFAFGEELGNYPFGAHLAPKQQQFGSDGWPISHDDPPLFDEFGFLQAQAPLPDESWLKSEPLDLDHPMQPPPFEEEQKTAEEGLPPLAPPLLTGEQLARVQGKLTKFLPGQMMAPVDHVDPNYQTVFEHQAARAEQQAAQSAYGRSMRQRRPLVRSRSPSPDLSDRSSTPELMDTDSAYDTDRYDQEEETTSRTTQHRQRQQQQHQRQPAQQQHYQPQQSHAADHPMDDTVSPPVVRYDDSSSGQSSSSPPAPTRLLPVSATELLPSRPSTAAIPPAHIKDRLVRSAKKLLTAADGVNDAVQVQVIPLYYPAKGAPGAHKIRLIRVENTSDKSVSVYAHAADVGGVVERKSNISRLFGKFESPAEKLLMNVVGAHNHTVGQESNILTSKGVRKFLALNKMKEEHAYRAWIHATLLPKLMHDPLEVGEEVLEIEASTDPRMPHQIKPKKLKRMEKKQQRRQQEKEQEQQQKLQEQIQAQAQQQPSFAHSLQSDVHPLPFAARPLPHAATMVSEPFVAQPPPAKRAKHFHSPTPSSAVQQFLSPNMPPFHPFGMQQLQPGMPHFSIGANASA